MLLKRKYITFYVYFKSSEERAALSKVCTTPVFLALYSPMMTKAERNKVHLSQALKH